MLYIDLTEKSKTLPYHWWKLTTPFYCMDRDTTYCCKVPVAPDSLSDGLQVRFRILHALHDMLHEIHKYNTPLIFAE